MKILLCGIEEGEPLAGDDGFDWLDSVSDDSGLM